MTKPNPCPICGWDMDKLKHCTRCREAAGMKHFDKVRNEVLKERKEG